MTPVAVGSGTQREYARVLELDHVLIAVVDLAIAAREIEARFGLASIEGGRHPGWGTANRIVPLGATYLELTSVVDEAKAAQNPFGNWVTQAQHEPTRLLGWAVRTHQLDEIAGGLGLIAGAGSRAMPDGQLLRWRTAGIEQAMSDPSLPFFIEWGQETPFPGRAPASHPAGAVQFAQLQLDGDPDRLAGWLGDHSLPITLRPGAPALRSIILTGAGGKIVLDEDQL